MTDAALTVTPEKLGDMLSDFILRQFDAEGEVMPMFHAVCANGEHLVCATMWENEAEKIDTLNHLREVFLERGVTFYAFVSEAWVARYDSTADRMNGLSPSQRSDRDEIVLMHICDKDGVQVFRQWRIVRPWDGGQPFLELMDVPHDGIAGRMTDLLSA